MEVGGKKDVLDSYFIDGFETAMNEAAKIASQASDPLFLWNLEHP